MKGTSSVVVKGYSLDSSINFTLEDRGPIRSIKFSNGNTYLAVQRTDNTIEFMHFHNNVANNLDIFEYKSKHNILGFVWIESTELALVLTNGIEIFQIQKDKKQLKNIKTCNINVSWFSWCTDGNFGIFASKNGSIMTPILLRPGTITKLPKLECKYS